MADDSHNTSFPDSATVLKMANAVACPRCAGEGVAVLPSGAVDACPRCALIAEIEWRQVERAV